MLHNTMYSVYNELSLSRDNYDQVTSRHHATYRTHNSNDRRQATRDPENFHKRYLIKYTRTLVNSINNRFPFHRLVDLTTTLFSCFHSSLILDRCLELLILLCINLIKVVKRLYNKLCSESTGSHCSPCRTQMTRSQCLIQLLINSLITLWFHMLRDNILVISRGSLNISGT